MQTQSPYAFSVPVSWDQTEAIERVTAALKDEGFGILTTIDVQATLKEKIDVDREPYVILGACAPQLANKALEAEPEIGVLLPCNVVVYQTNGNTRVSVMDPEAALGLTGNNQITDLAAEVKSRLQRVLASLSD
jgi:uncharacterized protein (DUF302 family)